MPSLPRPVAPYVLNIVTITCTKIRLYIAPNVIILVQYVPIIPRKCVIQREMIKCDTTHRTAQEVHMNKPSIYIHRVSIRAN